jgi:hypothetical protein
MSISRCCSAVLVGILTGSEPAAQPPPAPPDVTACPAAVGTHMLTAAEAEPAHSASTPAASAVTPRTRAITDLPVMDVARARARTCRKPVSRTNACLSPAGITATRPLRRLGRACVDRVYSPWKRPVGAPTSREHPRDDRRPDLEPIAGELGRGGGRAHPARRDPLVRRLGRGIRPTRAVARRRRDVPAPVRRQAAELLPGLVGPR